MDTDVWVVIPKCKLMPSIITVAFIVLRKWTWTLGSKFGLTQMLMDWRTDKRTENRIPIMHLVKKCTTKNGLKKFSAQQIRCFFHPKNADIFLISQWKHTLWYSLEAPRQGTSNEYPQHMFSLRNKKNIMWIPPLICSYEFLYIILFVSLYYLGNRWMEMEIYVSYQMRMKIRQKPVKVRNQIVTSKVEAYLQYWYTLQPLYNMVRYNTVLDITRFKDGSQKCIDYIEKWP